MEILEFLFFYFSKLEIEIETLSSLLMKKISIKFTLQFVFHEFSFPMFVFLFGEMWDFTKKIGGGKYLVI